MQAFAHTPEATSARLAPRGTRLVRRGGSIAAALALHAAVVAVLVLPPREAARQAGRLRVIPVDLAYLAQPAAAPAKQPATARPSPAVMKPRDIATVSAPPPQPAAQTSPASTPAFVPTPLPPAPKPIAETHGPPPPKPAPPRPAAPRRALSDPAPASIAEATPVVAASPSSAAVAPTTKDAAPAIAAVAPAAGAPPAASSAVPRWEDEVLARLERFMRYPRRARMRDEQGVAYLRVTIGRHGDVLSYALQRSSGVAALDAETLALVERARPFPAPPADLGRDHVELVVPIRYILR